MTSYTATPLPDKTLAHYKLTKTISKAAPAFVLIILIETLKSVLSDTNVQLSKDIIYNVTIALYGAYIGLLNWFKNRNKGKL